jgi:hypothetical protein
MPRKIFCATDSYEPNKHQMTKKPKRLASDAFQMTPDETPQNEISHKILQNGTEQARSMKRKARSIKDKEDINPNNLKVSSNKVNIHESTENKAQKAIGFAIQHQAKMGNLDVSESAKVHFNSSSIVFLLSYLLLYRLKNAIMLSLIRRF